MRLSRSLLLPCIIGVAQATSETAKVYIFQHPDFLSSSTTPTLTPEAARLIFAQRIGVAQYHSLSQASNDILAQVSTFGGREAPLFSKTAEDEDRSQLVVLIEDISSHFSQQLQHVWAKDSPSFEISNPPSKTSNTKLVRDLSSQSSLISKQRSCSIANDINPFKKGCWAGRAKILQLDAKPGQEDEITKITGEILQYVHTGAMDAMIVLMPASNRKSSKAYGTYDMPSHSHKTRDAPEEAPIEPPEKSPLHSSDNGGPVQDFQPLRVASFASCYSSDDSCQTATNNCSGHGVCYAKINSSIPEESCYTCQCVPTVVLVHDGNGNDLHQVTYWGGPACTKQDISGPFWLLAGLSVILVGLVSAGIGMLFSIGEEKLPSVIGAGVSGPKAR